MFQLKINNSCKCNMRNVKCVRDLCTHEFKTFEFRRNGAASMDFIFRMFWVFLKSYFIIRRSNLINANHKNKLHFMSSSFCGSCFSTSCLTSFHSFDLTSTFDALKVFFCSRSIHSFFVFIVEL